LTNAILWGNNGVEIQGSATITYSIINGGDPGIGNLEQYPLSVDATNGNLRCAPALPPSMPGIITPCQRASSPAWKALCGYSPPFLDNGLGLALIVDMDYRIVH
jgi:hypothetical protein